MATVTGLVAAASMLPVSVTTGSEARPSTPARVLWIGGTTRPTFMAEGDIWFRVAPTGPSLPEFVTIALNTITLSVPFTQALVLNGTSPFTFTTTAGSLPAGLTIHSTTGVISGTPSASGAYSFTIKATNAVGDSSRTFTGNVVASAVAPLVTTTTLTSLTQSTAFSQTLQATGTGPITWTISGGTLPSGLSLNSSNGTISGSPTGSGSYSFTVQATNTVGNDTQAYTGTIAASGTAPTITTTTLDALQATIPFSQVLNKTGSTPFTWGISAGTIPAGLSINSSTGAITGTPTTAGSYSFTVSATNGFGSDTQAYTGTISAAPTGTTYSIFNNTVPVTLTSHSDGGAGSWLSQQYYQATSGSPLAAGSKIIGARLYVPSGSAHIGAGWYGAMWPSPSGYRPGVGSGPGATEFDTNTNGSKKAGSALVAGWNELLFDSEYDVINPGGSWFIGVQMGDGSRYLFDGTLTTAAIQNPEGKNFYLTENGTSPVARVFFNGSVSSAHWYGIDVLVKIP